MKKALATFLAFLVLCSMPSFVCADVVLRLAVFDDANDDNLNIRDAISAFQNANPGITVTLEAYSGDYYKALETQFIARQAPDVFIVDVAQLVPLTMVDRLEPLDAYIDAYQYPADDILVTLRESFSIDGQFYGIAKDYNTVCLFYNTDLFEQLGLTPPTDISELHETSAAFSPHGITGIVLENDISCWYPAFAVPYGAQRALNESDQTVNSPEAIKALQAWADLFAAGAAKTPQAISESSAMDAFGKGSAAMIFETGEICKSIDNNYPNLHYGIAQIPSAQQKGSALYATAYALSAESTNKEIAFQLIAHLTNEENQYAAIPYQSALPSLQSLQQAYIEIYPKWEAFPQACEVSVPFAFGVSGPFVIEAMNTALLNASRGMDPEQALENAQKAIDALALE